MTHRNLSGWPLLCTAMLSLLLSVTSLSAQVTGGSGSDTISTPIEPAERGKYFPSISRAPTIGGGMYMHWLVMMINGGLRLEFEPVRDVIGVWGSIGIAPYFLSSDGSYSPSMLELGAGIRVHPLPFGEVGRFYVDLERRSYWGLNPWSVGVGVKLLPDYRRARLAFGLGLSYEWGEDTREIEEPWDQWRMVWVDVTGSIRLGLDEL